MPLKLKPHQTFTVWLDCDANDPIDQRAVFYGRVLSMADQLELDNAIEQSSDPETNEQFYTQRIDLLLRLLAGWQNLPAPYDAETAKDQLMQWLTVLETAELIRKLRDGQQMTEEEKKS